MAWPLLAGLGTLVVTGAGSAATAAGNAAGDLAKIGFDLAKILFRGTIFLAAITAFLIFVGMAIGWIGIALNSTIIGDLFTLLQYWLPFNLSSIFVWFTAVTIAYINYRLFVAASMWAHRLIG